jgi:hypothetical protein
MLVPLALGPGLIRSARAATPAEETPAAAPVEPPVPAR